ncbi:BglG family transcription antiterminator [Ligilactobacillus sp. WILCCON 0076]|uniref:BglG family transcription antiterminator n=1 Tax=Ligilactobacillus ubinensis TaxID=2876789 RepID=A0A9X2FK39_9LACO|nr:BglG family transcription antiterminator [Ligilactobacillus ubinensis]MCP0887042.1 BglG family transcription antiterminator [Ligilactobacillus ubinensis]
MRDKLIRVLELTSEWNELKLKDLANQLGVTTKTIRNDIRQLNELLASKKFDQIFISKGIIYNPFPSKKIKNIIHIVDENEQDDLYLPPKQRIVFLLMEFMVAKKPVFLIDLQEKMQISKSTMDNDMRDLRKLVQSYGLQIVTSHTNGVNVRGSERAIRMMFTDMFTRQPNILDLVLDGFKWPVILVKEARKIFDINDIIYLKKILQDVFYDSHLGENDNYQQQAIVLTMVWVSRIQNGHSVDRDTDVSELNTHQLKFVNLVIEHFNLKLVSKSEMSYLAFVISSFDSSETSELENWAKSQIICLALIEWMEEKLEFPFSKSESLFERVYKHISALIRRQNRNINAYNPLKKTIMQSYPQIFDAVKHFFDKKNQKYKMILSDDEIGYLAIYFSTAQVEIRQEQVYKYRIAVICNYGLATGRLLAASLEENFNVDVLAILSISELDVLNKIPIGLVFKTVDVDVEGFPSLKVSPILSTKDIQITTKFLKKHSNLAKHEKRHLEPTRLFNSILIALKSSNINIDNNLIFELQRVFEKNKLKINEREVQPMLKDIINNNQIQLKVTANGWKDAITKSSQPLLDEGYIKPEYIKAMIDSVEDYGPYIVIGPSIALAHARPEDGAKKLGVSIMTLAHPINFGNSENDPVKIIFCLAAVDNYSHLNVMKTIVQLINNQDKVEKLIGISDINEFRKVLFDPS